MQPASPAGATSARPAPVCPPADSPHLVLVVTPEMVHAAESFRRGRLLYANSAIADGPVGTALDLSAHQLANLVADEIANADARQLLADMDDAFQTYSDIERERERRPARRRR